MSACPKCNSEIADATYCGCGWKRPKKPVNDGPVDAPRVKCCHDICGRLSVVKVITPTGWANLCLEHYEDRYRVAAQRKCNELGLQTVAQKRKWVLENMPSFAPKLPMIEREPGEDLEEMTA